VSQERDPASSYSLFLDEKERIDAGSMALHYNLQMIFTFSLFIREKITGDCNQEEPLERRIP